MTHVQVRVVGVAGGPAVSQDIAYDIEVASDTFAMQFEDLVSHVDAINEIPNSVRRDAALTLRQVGIAPP